MRKPVTRIAFPEVLEAQKSLSLKHDTLPPALLHVIAFGALQNGEIDFSPETIAQTLVKNGGEPNSTFVADVIDTFHPIHEGKWPLVMNTFVKLSENNQDKPDIGFALHLGTGRFFNQDASFNSDNWNRFISLLPENSVKTGRISYNDISSFLSVNQTLPDEARTNRKDDPLNPFDTKAVQFEAAKAGWVETFKILAMDYEDNGTVPIVDLSLLKLFFTNTPLCLTVAKQNGIPVLPSAYASSANEVNEVLQKTETAVLGVTEKIHEHFGKFIQMEEKELIVRLNRGIDFFIQKQSISPISMNSMKCPMRDSFFKAAQTEGKTPPIPTVETTSAWCVSS